jgi:hypothetical protein
MFGHFRRYTRSTLTALFDATDSAITRCHYWDVLGVLPWWVSFVLLRRSVMSGGMVKVYDGFVVPVARVLESAVRPPLGKNLILVARKNGTPAA